MLFGGTTYIATAGAAGLEPDLYPAAWGVLAQGVGGADGACGSCGYGDGGDGDYGFGGDAGFGDE